MHKAFSIASLHFRGGRAIGWKDRSARDLKRSMRFLASQAALRAPKSLNQPKSDDRPPLSRNYVVKIT